MALNGINSVVFFVTDIESSSEWYSRFFDCQPVEDLPEFKSFKISNSYLNLHIADEKSPLSTGGQVAYWSTNNFDLDIARARELGAILWRGPLEFEPGKWICQIQDPFGNIFGMENW